MIDLKQIATVVDQQNEKEQEEAGSQASDSAPEENDVYAPPLIAESHDAVGNILKTNNTEESAEETQTAEKNKEESTENAQAPQDAENQDETPEEEAEEEEEEATELPELAAPELPEEASDATPPPPLDGPYQYINDDGNIVTVMYEAGELNGPFQITTPDEKPLLNAEFKKGKLTGICQVYENEKLQSETEFLDDEMNGTVKQYNEEGNVILTLTFENGKKKGEMQEYYPNGTPALITTFDNDQMNGKMQNYNEQNDMILEAEYKNDKVDGVMQNFYSGEDGHQLMRKAEYKEGTLDGEEAIFYPTGEPLSLGKYTQGKLQEPVQTFSKKEK